MDAARRGGVEPLRLFRTLNVHEQLASRMRPLGAGILAHGLLDPREREIVIHRTCARAGAEYEWGVHALAFGRPLGLSDAQIAATVNGGAEDPAWDEGERLLVELADELHESASVSERAVGAPEPPLQRRADHRAARDGRLVPAALLRHQRRRVRARAVGGAIPAGLSGLPVSGPPGPRPGEASCTTFWAIWEGTCW